MATYLVTGGAGFIGSNIVDRLVEKGETVRVLDNLSTGKLENLKHLGDRVTFIRGDICDRDAAGKACAGVDYVLHHAAICSVERSVDDPVETVRINELGTVSMLEAARKNKVKRFVHASSSAIYGDQEKYPTSEADEPKPCSPYAASKLSGEYYCGVFGRLYGLETVSLRYFNVFGPRQHPASQYASVIPAFVKALSEGAPPNVHWDGKQTRDFIYVGDVARANFLAATVPAAGGKVFNVASGEEISLLEILDATEKILTIAHIAPNFSPKRKGDVRKTLADVKYAKQHLQFSAETSFYDGMKKTVAWFSEQCGKSSGVAHK